MRTTRKKSSDNLDVLIKILISIVFFILGTFAYKYKHDENKNLISRKCLILNTGLRKFETYCTPANNESMCEMKVKIK